MSFSENVVSNISYNKYNYIHFVWIAPKNVWLLVFILIKKTII